MTKFGCNYTSSTTNRGVEAKEVEIANTRLDRNATESSSSFPSTAPSDTPAPDADVSSSYVQVVVQKHRRVSPRLPAASSPVRQAGEAAGAGDGNVLLVPASLLLACPSHQQAHPNKIVRECARGAEGGASGGAGSGAAGGGAGSGAGDCATLQQACATEQKILQNSAWKIIGDVAADGFDSSENVPERVEVYYFERAAGAYLATCGARRDTRVEAARRRAARVAGAGAAELLAAGHLLLALPASVLVAVERCVLSAVRDAVTGGVQTAADYALKPALALAFNALLQPPLVFCANVARALREVVRPLTLLVGDVLEPLTRAVGSLRLVHVRVDSQPASPPHACRCGRERV